MNRSHARMVASAIRQLLYRVQEQKDILQDIPERFPMAHLEAMEELLDRFMNRLGREDTEPISTEVANPDSSVARIKQGQNHN